MSAALHIGVTCMLQAVVRLRMGLFSTGARSDGHRDLCRPVRASSLDCAASNQGLDRAASNQASPREGL